jgi:hypothetical protein
MNTRTFILAGTATLALGLGPATAGPCTTEIDNLSKVLAGKDPRSGVTSGAGGTQSPATPSAQRPSPPITGQQAEGKAASPQSMRLEAEDAPAPAPKDTTDASAANEATAELDRARALDQLGKEAECMESVRQARRLAGAN